VDRETYTDLVAIHNVHSQRYGSFTVNRMLKQLNRVDREITLRLQELMEGLTEREISALIANNFTTRRLVSIRDQVREMASQARRIVGGELRTRAEELIEYEAAWAVGITGAIAEIPEFNGPSVSQVYSSAQSRPMLGKHVRDHVRDLDTQTRNLVFGAIREGFLIGDSVPTIARRIRGSAAENFTDGELFRRNRGVETVVRTALKHYSINAIQATYESMGVKEYQWLSVLDSRTCLTADTPILTPGGYLPISEINKGDVVIGHSGEGREVNATLKTVSEKICTVTLENGEKIKCTPDHRWMTSEGWVEAKDLTPDHDIAELQ